MDGDQLLPAEGDHDAEYTEKVYDLNDSRKQLLRSRRAEVIGDATKAIREFPRLLDRLLEAAASADQGLRMVLLESASHLREKLIAASRQTSDFKAIPDDSDPSCRCPDSPPTALPEFLERQCQVMQDAEYPD